MNTKPEWKLKKAPCGHQVMCLVSPDKRVLHTKGCKPCMSAKEPKQANSFKGVTIGSLDKVIANPSEQVCEVCGQGGGWATEYIMLGDITKKKFFCPSHKPKPNNITDENI